MQAPLQLSDRPRLSRRTRLRFDRRTSAHLLLSPERGLILSESAAAILLACSGTRTVAQIAHHVAKDADLRAVTRDVLEFLSALRRRHLIELGEPWA